MRVRVCFHLASKIKYILCSCFPFSKVALAGEWTLDLSLIIIYFLSLYRLAIAALSTITLSDEFIFYQESNMKSHNLSSPCGSGWARSLNVFLFRRNLWNENNSLRNAFIEWSRWWCMTGLNTEPNIVGREQDSRETEGECLRDRVLLKTRDGVGNKFDHWRKYLWQMWEDN